jgi:hypothetical protein
MTRIVLDFQFTRRIWRVYELGIGNWVGNAVIDVFAWKTIKDSTVPGYPTSTNGSKSWMVLLCIICMGNMKDTTTMDAVVW